MESKKVSDEELFYDYNSDSGILYLQRTKSKKNDGVPTEWISGKSVPIEC